jgi:pyruvate carboxylase
VHKCPSRRSSSPTGRKSPSASSARPTNWGSKRSRSGPRKTNIRFTASRRRKLSRSGAGPHLAKDLGPIESYLSIDEVIRVAKLSGADAIHPGYGLLSESPEFADACAEAGITFIGPKPETMRRLGNKVAARNLAIEVGVPVIPATDPLPDDMEVSQEAGAEVGYPVMLKASWGGGGRGMRAIRSEADLAREVTEGKREAKAAFGKDEVYLEKLIERARHVEVQVLGDTHGNAVHLFERDCSIQRRNQKVVERAPAPYLSTELRRELCGYALKIADETAISAPARSSSCRTPTPANSTSSRSIRASRSSTPSPSR